MRGNVLTLLERLHVFREHIAHAYHQGTVERTDENRRAVEILHQHRVLIPHRHDQYRMHSTLRRFFDVALNTERMLHEAADVGAVFTQLDALVDSYVQAFHEGQQDVADACEDEIAQALFEITDRLQIFITNLQTNIETRFATVTSISAKRIQNEYYLKNTEQLVETLNQFHFSDLRDRVAPFERIDELFRTQLFDRLPVFRDALQRIYETLRAFLFEYRQIEARARRLNAMWLHLRRNADYEPRAWDEAVEVPTWLHRASRLPVITHADIADEACEEGVTLIAQSIPPALTTRTRQREVGVIADHQAVAPVVKLTPKPHVAALRRLFKEARGTNRPISVRAWGRALGEVLDLTDQLWLEVVLDALVKGGGSTRGVPFTVLSPPVEPFAFAQGNVAVHDIEVGTWKSV